MKGVSESLAGRAGVLELDGISLAELAGARAVTTPEEACLRGSMPELWSNRELDAAAYYQAYVITYLERDLRALLEVGSLRDFERFLRACALRSAQVLNKAELARDVGISPTTAGAWLSVLEASNQVFLLEPWFANKTKSLVKSPKLFLCDSGLLCYLMGIRTLDDLAGSAYVGAVWETFVCGELRKKVKAEERGDVYYWRDRTKEADFLIHKAGRFEVLDAKWNELPDKKDAAVLERVMDELPTGSVMRAALICRTGNAYPIRGKIQAVPVAEA
jgi:predicted AAA+ superfamily ATPase